MLKSTLDITHLVSILPSLDRRRCELNWVILTSEQSVNNKEAIKLLIPSRGEIIGNEQVFN